MLPSAIGVITAFARPRFGTDALGRKQALRVVDLLTGAERVVQTTTSPVPADSDVNFKYTNTDMCFSPSWYEGVGKR
jgi:hypothetical protein